MTLSVNFIFILILVSALCHAVWSAIIKSSKNPLSLMGITSVLEVTIFLPLTFTVPFPTLEVWYFLIATVIIHVFYRLNVIYSYRYGDLSYIYPISRGSSCLFVAIISILFLSSDISVAGFVGILIVCIGLFLISYSKNLSFNFRGFALAISTAILITAYTLVDGVGVRLSENGFSYIYWLFTLNGIPLLIIGLISKDGLRKRETYTFRSGIAAGVFATSSYAIVVWSMQFIEIAYVSSIREISIVFAAIIGMLFLFEKNAKSRIIPSILIVSGISVVYFQIL
ncbi:DMT family transporter [Pelagibacteraceae bacterium]|jgi:drug/metabolite transporter (DMT)-like permease|nr:DMT family transporter [Pelagibacteraceae bacterium]